VSTIDASKNEMPIHAVNIVMLVAPKAEGHA
jgi:hypothetical protein